MKAYTYYLTQRPPSFGTYPDGTIEDPEEVFVEAKARRTCYKLVYDVPLFSEDIRRYELLPKIENFMVGSTYEKPGLKLTIKEITECGSLITIEANYANGKFIERDTYLPRGVMKEFGWDLHTEQVLKPSISRNPNLYPK